jgi:hypothetical protein
MPQRRERRAELVRNRRDEVGLQPGHSQLALNQPPQQETPCGEEQNDGNQAGREQPPADAELLPFLDAVARTDHHRPRETRLEGSAADGTLARGCRAAEQDVAGGISQAHPRIDLADKGGRTLHPSGDERGHHCQRLDMIRGTVPQKGHHHVDRIDHTPPG